jgi:hypothetical protein
VAVPSKERKKAETPSSEVQRGKVAPKYAFVLQLLDLILLELDICPIPKPILTIRCYAAKCSNGQLPKVLVHGFMANVGKKCWLSLLEYTSTLILANSQSIKINPSIYRLQC